MNPRNVRITRKLEERVNKIRFKVWMSHVTFDLIESSSCERDFKENYTVRIYQTDDLQF